jgi:lipopolysaccharide/colanic/teichoic acid biosynthesis glycosyltransferase
MSYRNKKTIIVFCLLALLCLLEPSLRTKLTFAVTSFDQPNLNSQQIDPNQTAHAPEPSTFILLLGGLTGVIVRFSRKSFDRFKRYSDLLLSILALTVTLPILIFAAILIKLNSRGPVIYKQNRVGKKGEIFKIYKLRTMRIDAEEKTGAVWAREKDSRITSVGRVLRKTHIDEIPQLFNVLKGQMSIVGPRPERPEMVRDLKELICDYEKRLQINPGITGLAQVWHKYDETIQDVKKKIKYDLLYIRKMCLLVDLRIMAQTFVVVLTGRGAR